MEISTVATEGAGIVGLTGFIARYVPDEYRDALLPFVAMFLGVLFTAIPVVVNAGTYAELAASIATGVVLGGASTGLYAVGKNFTSK